MRRLHRQRGVAVVTALLLTTLAITIVTSLFWQQQVQVRSMENQRLHLQTGWILRGALDYARLVLRQDSADKHDWTTLDDVWTTPLAETRLDQYIERERLDGETYDATISGRIVDATSRYNLRNLSSSDYVPVYRQLLLNLQLDEALAERTRAYVVQSVTREPEPAQGQGGQQPGQGQPQPQTAQRSKPVPLERMEDLLAIEGYTPQIVEKLRPFVIVLPQVTPINVNTAPPEVLAALIQAGTGEGTAMAAARKQAWWKSKADFSAQLAARIPGRTPPDSTYDVRSDFFLVQSRVKLDRAALNAEALIFRSSRFKADLMWIRQD
jgi:general secretion pathway protein K